MMDAIARNVETDPEYKSRVHFTETLLEPTTADALSAAAGQIVDTVSAKAVCVFTSSGSTARRASRERFEAPLLVLTPKLATARRLGLLWGAHAVHTRDVSSFEEMVDKAKRMALRAGVAGAGDRVIIMAGVPFGTPGSTNVLHVVRLTGDELKGRK
jgi:pyruvate kinase